MDEEFAGATKREEPMEHTATFTNQKDHNNDRTISEAEFKTRSYHKNKYNCHTRYLVSEVRFVKTPEGIKHMKKREIHSEKNLSYLTNQSKNKVNLNQ